ncbi:hypothetical protein Hanom_Chr15g01393951 [Helianthus anomalus]
MQVIWRPLSIDPLYNILHPGCKAKSFLKFKNTSEALSAVTLLLESKPDKGLRKFLHAHCDSESLAVADSKLGNVTKEKLQIDCVHNQAVMELMRGVISQLT